MTSSIPRRSAWCAKGVLCVAVTVFAGRLAGAETVDGFVSRVASPTDFYMGSLRVVTDGKTQCATETLDADFTWRYEPNRNTRNPFSDFRLFDLPTRPEPKSRKAVPCASVPLVIGSRVQIAGDATGPDGAVLAAQLTLYNVKFDDELIVLNTMNRPWQGGALVEEPPQVEQTEKGFTGSMWIDGYPMAIAPGMELLTAPAGTKLSYRPPGSHAKHPKADEALGVPALKGSRWDAVMPEGPVPPFAATLFKPNTWAVYQGSAPSNGQVPLASIRLWPNEVDQEEENYLAGLAPVVRAPDYAGHVPGSVGFQGGDKPKSVAILADENIQKYVTALGGSLIAEYQRALPEQDKTKIHFHFYVVQGEPPLQNDEMETVEGVAALSQDRLDAGAVAFPNGVVLVPDTMLAKIGNEAELAAILSDLITVVIEKQGYIARSAWSDKGIWGRIKDPCGDYGGCTDPLLVLPFFRDEQTLRIGIRQMYLAGYDIREAPIAWAAAAGKPTNPFPKKKKNPDQVPWETAYAFDYISRFYSDVDFSKLTRGEAEYAQFLDALRKADPEAFAEKTVKSAHSR